MQYSEVRERALNNDHTYHVAAILWRRGKPIDVFTNSHRKSPVYFRYHSVSKPGRPSGSVYCQHAEMAALRSAKPGDKLEVIRFREDGSIGCAKPCQHCEKRIKKLGLRVRYTDDEGVWRWLDK